MTSVMTIVSAGCESRNRLTVDGWSPDYNGKFYSWKFLRITNWNRYQYWYHKIIAIESPYTLLLHFAQIPFHLRFMCGLLHANGKTEWTLRISEFCLTGEECQKRALLYFSFLFLSIRRHPTLSENYYPLLRGSTPHRNDLMAKNK